MTGITTLAQRLLDLTREAAIDWESSGTQKLGRFVFSSDNASVVLEVVPGRGDSRDRIRMSVLNASGDPVDEIEVYRQALAPRSAVGINIAAALFDDPTEKLINALYATVRRTVMRANEVIDGLLESLDSEEPEE